MRFEYQTTFVPVAYEKEETGGMGYPMTAGYYFFWKRVIVE